MSLNALNRIGSVPSNLWKAKQRVHYEDQKRNIEQNESNNEFASKPNSMTDSLPKLAVYPPPPSLPSPLRSIEDHHQKSVQRTARSPCDHCGYHNIPVMVHLPISTMGRSQNQLELIEYHHPNDARQDLLSPRNELSGCCIQRKSSNSSMRVASQDLQVSRRPSLLLQEIVTTRRPSFVVGGSKRRENTLGLKTTKAIGSLPETRDGSTVTINAPNYGCGQDNGGLGGPKSFHAKQFKVKNRRVGNDALSSALSATYCKLLVLMGVCLPITEVISDKIPIYVYKGFYAYLYAGSILFVLLLYTSAFRSRALFNVLKNFHEKNTNIHVKQKAHPFGSFYLRVGAIAFAIGTMVYSGLEFGQFIELHGQSRCHNIFLAITPVCRMILCIAQVQFIFLNTTYMDMARHKVTSRFGLMHMVATNLCEWLYVLVEETKHEIFHVGHHEQTAMLKSTSGHWTPISTTVRVTQTTTPGGYEDQMSGAESNATRLHGSGCTRTNIMGALVQEVSPFLFPCTIEYSLICAVMLYEMWKSVRSIPEIDKTRKNSIKPVLHAAGRQKNAHQFSVDCSQSHRGLFFGILVIVTTIISMIMYFVLYSQAGYEKIATQEVTLWEIFVYFVCTAAVLVGTYRMRDLKYVQETAVGHRSMKLDCTLLIVAQTGVYLHGIFSIMGSYFSKWDTVPNRVEGIVDESLGLLQTSLQTLFILHASHRRCKGAKQQRQKPGREIVTFLLVANIAIWFIHTMIKGRAVFRVTHMEFFGLWAWTIITHVSMPLAIFYRFHSTICLFEVWKITYKAKLY